MLSIAELINVSGIIGDLKIHLAIGPKDDYYEPLKKFENNEFEEWQSYQTKKNFSTNYLASFITYDQDLWLFAGVYKVLDNPIYDKDIKAYHYPNIKKLDNGLELIGRLIVRYQKKARQTYRYANGVIEEMILHSIAESKVESFEFPGYKNVSIKFPDLRACIKRQEKTWETALSLSKGVYAITDQSDGKVYIGSATGSECFWGRWSSYIDSGHGGNKKLKEILKKKGFEHSDNFKFSIIESFDIESPDSFIIEREGYWKRVFLTREFGNNDN